MGTTQGFQRVEESMSHSLGEQVLSVEPASLEKKPLKWYHEKQPSGTMEK